MRNLTPQNPPNGVASSSQDNSNPFSGNSDSSPASDSPPSSSLENPQNATLHSAPSHAITTNDEYYQPPARNPFLSDSNSDEASLSSDQYLSQPHGSSNVQYQNHYFNNEYYGSKSNSNSNLLQDDSFTNNQATAYSDYSPIPHGVPTAVSGPMASSSPNPLASQNYQASASDPSLPPPIVPPNQHNLIPNSQPYGIATNDGTMSTAAAERAVAASSAIAGSFLAPPSSRPSSSSLNAMNQSSSSQLYNVNAMSSAEFDRYPNRISSAAPSIVSASGGLNQHNNLHNSNLENGSGIRSSTVSSGSSFSDTDSFANPFVVNADFSPFGGYPASSFPLHMDEKEADDYLHNPDPILDAKYDRKCHKLDKRGWASLTALLCLVLGGLVVFAVLPAITFSGAAEEHRLIVKEIEVLTNYEYNILGAIRSSLVDPDTPQDARTATALDGSKWTLVFSDEFNKEGRTFYDGEDQFWTAPDFHYAATKDLEWYDPDACITKEGTLNLRLDAFKNHDLFYRSGMLQSWNKFCFTQGKIEVSALLPGNGSILGLWPGIWTLGNLARPGFLATAEGVWPYSYDSCDAGITPNQSSTDGISYLKGQKLNACTCEGADHPNPGTGRGAPEIDALEGTVDSKLKAGVVSQSLQVAPYDIWYLPDLNFIEIYNHTVTQMNSWNGGPLQQAVSLASSLNATWYEVSETPRYQTYGFEYLNDDDKGYIRWFVGDQPTFTMFAGALGPNGNVDRRPISKEPMSIILNLGISTSWVYIDWPSLVWPSILRIDYVRIYQPKDQINVGCDPPSHPTYKYIQDHLDIYTNPNFTVYDDTPYEWPKNKLTGC